MQPVTLFLYQLSRWIGRGNSPRLDLTQKLPSGSAADEQRGVEDKEDKKVSFQEAVSLHRTERGSPRRRGASSCTASARYPPQIETTL